MATFFTETERLLFREIEPADAEDLFEMDSDPMVHRFINNTPLTAIAQVYEVVELLQKQYRQNGIARWAVINKSNDECIGWAGIKYHREPMNNHVNFYEHGYRFKRKHWGKGYATESSKAIIKYAFENLNTDDIYATTDIRNLDSKKVLLKTGFKHIETFNMDRGPTDWFRLNRLYNLNEKSNPRV